MTKIIVRLALLGLSLFPCGGTAAPQTALRLMPSVINGDDDVVINALNDRGAVAGMRTDKAGYHVFIVIADDVTELMRELPGINGCCAPVVGLSTMMVTWAAHAVKV